jgi:hypothetical protein
MEDSGVIIFFIVSLTSVCIIQHRRQKNAVAADTLRFGLDKGATLQYKMKHHARQRLQLSCLPCI